MDEKKIALHVNVEPVSLGIEQALSCGLLINECITNAIKHAFDKEGGKIHIIFTCKDSSAFLHLYDTGKGLAQNFCITEAQGFGMQLIEGIATHQLQGELLYFNDQGTHFQIRFNTDSE